MKIASSNWLLGVTLLSSFCLTSCDSPSATAPSVPTADLVAAGSKIYTQTCASCHMVDGSGVPNMQPALDSNAVVSGDPTVLIRVLLQGPAKVLPADREHYANTMPPMSQLSDEQIADVLTYIRQTYGGQAGPIYAEQVKTVRTQFGAN